MRYLLVVGTVALVACSSGTTRATSALTPAPQASAAVPTPVGSSPTSPATVLASYARTQPGQVAGGAAAGSISGNVNCACDGLPAQDVYAISSDGQRFYATQTVPWQTAFRMTGVPAGHYYVYSAERFARSADGTYEPTRRFAAGFTKAVACGATVDCNDHSPVDVNVRPGSDAAGVKTFDWYASDFPLVPSLGPPPPMLPAMPSAFGSAHDAAVYLGTVATAAQYVAGGDPCPANRACFWLVSSRDGSGAAYFSARAASTDQSILCGLYLIGSGSAWRTFRTECGSAPIFPAVGVSGRVGLGIGETGCVNIHNAPSLSSSVVACVAGGTAVTIDGGPDYVPSGLPAGNDIDGDSYWWHLAGRGWMVHPYLRAGPQVLT